MEFRKFIATTIREYLNESQDLDIEKYSKSVEALMNDIESRYDVDLFIYYNKFAHTIILSKIVIDKKNRGKGIGTNVMNEICDFADKNKLRIGLTPSSDFGGSKTRLIQFYKNFGFKNYKGYEFRESMIRVPQ
jgi:GNAT superfamily N-acetyltransferase